MPWQNQQHGAFPIHEEHTITGFEQHSIFMYIDMADSLKRTK